METNNTENRQKAETGQKAFFEGPETHYKAAEALVNMGHYTYDVALKKIEWTDQLYIIYGLKPQSEKITYNRFVSFIHPDDVLKVKKNKSRLIREKHISYNFRIITHNGDEKTLAATAQVITNENGKAIRIIGAEQDITERQQHITSLQHSQLLFKQAEALAKIGNWRCNMASGQVFWSDEMYRIYEVEPGTTINFEKLLSFCSEDLKSQIKTNLKKTLDENQVFNEEHIITTGLGNVKTVHCRAEAFTNEEGEKLLIGTAQDISHQKKTEEALQQQQEFNAKITDATPAIISVFNAYTGKYLFVNKGMKNIAGYDPEDYAENGVSFFKTIIHPDDRAAILKKLNAALEALNHNPESMYLSGLEWVYRMKHKTEGYRWMRTNATVFGRNAEKKVEQLLTITIDISAQMENASRIQQQEYFIKRIADASPVIIYLVNVPSGNIHYINEEITYVLGYTLEELNPNANNFIEELCHPDDIVLMPERKGNSTKFEHDDTMVQYECRLKAKDGSWHWMLVREVVFKKDEHGNVEQILGTALDITKRREMEKTMLQNALLLEQSNASLEEFAYVASHDLKEPLRKISTFGDRLMASQMDRMTDDGKLFLKKIIDASQRMQVMISDLLSISMISGDKSFQTYSLQQILEEVKQTLDFKIEQKAALIESDDLPQAYIIPSQFRQLFQNLISNSLKFVTEEIQPHVRITHNYINEEGAIAERETAAFLQLVFEDNGIGFDDEFAGKIFIIFQRLHGRSEYEGSGIGLAICKKIVEHHGGFIYANGSSGRGAIFTIHLPLNNK